MDGMAPMRWLMVLKDALLSGAEMSGSSGGLGMDIRTSITVQIDKLVQDVTDVMLTFFYSLMTQASTVACFPFSDKVRIS